MFSAQCLLPGLPGYLIRFAPLAFIPHRHIRAGAFAIVGPPRISVFYHYPGRTPHVARCLAAQYLLRALPLRGRISQETYAAGYGCFRPSSCGCDLGCRDYRGGWHRSCPALIRLPFYSRQKLLSNERSTPARFVTLSRIAKNSRLLHPVGLGPVSQGPSQGPPAKGPYRS